MTPAKPAAPRAVPAAGSKSITEQAVALLENAVRDDIAAFYSDFGSEFWCAIERSARTNRVAGGDPDPAKLVAIIGEALADPERGPQTLAAIAEFIGNASMGIVPDVGAKLLSRGGA